MFRENVLTRDEIIDRIGSTMIPVAVDRWKAEEPGTREAKFLQPFLEKNPPEGSPCIYSPEGKVLGGFRGYGDMAGRTRKLIEDALKVHGPVKPRQIKAIQTHPFRGKGVMPDGSVRLAAYLRPSSKTLASLTIKSPVISSIALTRGGFKTLAPPRPVVGAKWLLPDEAARQFARVTSPLCRQHAPEPDWVTAVRIQGEVQTLKDEAAVVRYEGRIASEHHAGGTTVSVQMMTFTGEGIYDLKSKEMCSILLVGSGTLRWPEAPGKLFVFEVLVEWDIERP